MENEKYLFVVSGAAGTGKDSVVNALRKAHPEIEKTVSATTRSPRPGEKEGVDYYYRTREQFQQLIDTDQVVEHNFYNGNYYGTLREEVDKRLKAGKVVVLVIDVHGAANIRRSPALPPSSCCPLLWRSWSAACGAAAPRQRRASGSVLPPRKKSWPRRISSPSRWSIMRWRAALRSFTASSASGPVSANKIHPRSRECQKR